MLGIGIGGVPSRTTIPPRVPVAVPDLVFSPVRLWQDGAPSHAHNDRSKNPRLDYDDRHRISLSRSRAEDVLVKSLTQNRHLGILTLTIRGWGVPRVHRIGRRYRPWTTGTMGIPRAPVSELRVTGRSVPLGSAGLRRAPIGSYGVPVSLFGSGGHFWSRAAGAGGRAVLPAAKPCSSEALATVG